MSVVELYGKCKELGYCDCGGFLGCIDDEPMVGRPRQEPEEVIGDRPLVELADEPELPTVKESGRRGPRCAVCGKELRSNHVCKGKPRPRPKVEQVVEAVGQTPDPIIVETQPTEAPEREDLVFNPPADHRVVIEVGGIRVTIERAS